jgi:hypothetical protein
MPYRRLAEIIQEALCAQIDPELFFPDKGGSNREAKEICRACTIVPECLLESLENDFTDGIWGGLSARERQVMKRNKLQVVLLREEVEKRARERHRRNSKSAEQQLAEEQEKQQVQKVRSADSIRLEKRRVGYQKKTSVSKLS